MKALINTFCTECESNLKVEVDFPEVNKGFTSKEHVCSYCQCELLVEDNHIYKNGSIIN